MNAVGIDVSKGRSMVAILRPGTSPLLSGTYPTKSSPLSN